MKQKNYDKQTHKFHQNHNQLYLKRRTHNAIFGVKNKEKLRLLSQNKKLEKQVLNCLKLAN